MAATTMATILNLKSFKAPPTTKTASLLPITTFLPKGLTMSSNQPPLSLSAAAIAGAFFSTLSTSEPAMAVQQIAEIAEGDNRGQLLLIVVAPALLWVLYNILQPALNQLNKMRSTKGVIAGLGLGALGASGFMFTPEASAASEAAAGDNRGQLLLLVVAPAILWVLYNILQPALNQINKMRND